MMKVVKEGTGITYMAMAASPSLLNRDNVGAKMHCMSNKKSQEGRILKSVRAVMVETVGRVGASLYMADSLSYKLTRTFHHSTSDYRIWQITRWRMLMDVESVRLVLGLS
jgi:hypothetical protein